MRRQMRRLTLQLPAVFSHRKNPHLQQRCNRFHPGDFRETNPDELGNGGGFGKDKIMIPAALRHHPQQMADHLGQKPFSLQV